MKNYRSYAVVMLFLLCLISSVALAQEATSEPVDAEIETVVYGEADGMDLILDVYQPATSDTPLPAVILIHGGAGMFADRSVEADRAQGLAANGYVSFNIDYRLFDGGKNPWPAQLEDAQLAVRWI